MEQLAPVIEEPRIKNKHTDDLIDHYWGSINYVTSLIKSSELKAGLILTFYGILLNFIYQSWGMLIKEISSDVLFDVLVGLWFICTGASIFFSVRCFMPKIEGNYDKNIFFFGDVISKFGNIKEFARTFYTVSLDEDLLFEQLGEQIYIISKIAAWKFRNVKRAIYLLALGLFLLLVVVVYFILMTF
ncbi:Pycsar system effector family protein [Gillisia sp. CAL575]|uniref:Pycsar system effector family protein n=1 Tax=Gillisia sp. CAL575 TaxID=985255 RepID=UPI00039B1CAE|nr:Pycsar system effector family protein [Gillisia sp. CAL575]